VSTTRRFGVLTALSSVFAGLVIAIAPGTAYAALCQNEPDLGDAHFVDVHDDLKVFHILSFQEVFNIAQSANGGLGGRPPTVWRATWSVLSADTRPRRPRTSSEGLHTHRPWLSACCGLVMSGAGERRAVRLNYLE
jgi:hypothetical protein